MAVNATAIWRVRPSGSNTNGGGYDPGISGAATDYSQQNSAQASGTNGVTVGTTAFVDATASAFTSAMVGNAVYITGSGQTTGWYFVTGYTSSSTVTLDRSPGTGTGATWYLGGGWADFWTNTTSSGPVVAGNTVYILGSGVPNPSSYSYDYSPSEYFTSVSGSSSAGRIKFVGDPATPNGGVPCISTPGELFVCTLATIQNLWLVAGSATGNTNGVLYLTYGRIINCVLDQNGYDIGITSSNTALVDFIGCEVFSSVAKRSTNSQYAMFLGCSGSVCSAFGCNIHDCIGPGVALEGASTMGYCIVAKNGGDGVYATQNSANPGEKLFNCVIDGNAGNGVEIGAQSDLAYITVFNNIISNHTTASTYGMTVDAGTTAANNLIKGFIDYNTFYNNTTDLNAISYGAHDTSNSGSAPKTISSSPYVNSATENYTLA